MSSPTDDSVIGRSGPSFSEATCPDLWRLTRRLQAKYVRRLSVSGRPPMDYAAHGVIRQALLRICGPYDWTVAGPYPSGDESEPVALIGTLTVTIDNDVVVVSGVGQGRDMKSAESDAIKRAAMNVGLGLHLWVDPDEYFLHPPADINE